MLKWIKNEIIAINIILRLRKVVAEYNAILLHLGKLIQLTDTLGGIGLDIQRDAKNAEDQCRECIRRFNNVLESLYDRDYRYLNHQLIFAARQTKEFEETAQKVHTDAVMLASCINKKRRQ